MDSKNVLIAVLLSSIVIVVWGLFFEPPIAQQQKSENTSVVNEESSYPTIDEDSSKKEVSRNDVINTTNRIKVENQNIKGSISLKGAIIDDIIFKNYKKSLDSPDKVIFLNPKNSANEYFIETGWALGGAEKVKLPLDNTIWKVKGNRALTPSTPITLEWNNNEGLIFTKKIELDDKFLFKITQSIKNTSINHFNFSLTPKLLKKVSQKLCRYIYCTKVLLGYLEKNLKKKIMMI